MTKKPKKASFVVSIDLYKRDILISLGETDKERQRRVAKLLRRDLSEKEMECCELRKAGRAIMFQNGASLLSVREIPTDPYWRGVLAHEVFHVTDFIMDEVGIKLSPTSDEAYAYLIASITEHIYRKIK